MKLSKGMIALIAGVAFSGVASAQDQAAVSAEKQAPIKTLIPGAYGKIEVRHDVLRSMNKDEVENDKPQVNFRPTLGLTMFNDAVDTSFTYVFKHAPGDNTIKKSDVYNETLWNVVQGKFNDASPYSFGPYAFTDFLTETNKGSYAYSDVGFYAEANYELPIPTGALAFQIYTNPMGEFISNQTRKDHPVTVENRTNRGADKLGLALDGEGNPQAEQRDPTIVNYSGVSAKYKPAAVKGLSVGLATDANQSWVPVYAAKTVDGDTRTDLDHYSAQAFMMNRLIVSYKFNDKVSLTNQTRQFVGGYWQRSIDVNSPDRTTDSVSVGPYRWENRLSLVATLF